MVAVTLLPPLRRAWSAAGRLTRRWSASAAAAGASFLGAARPAAGLLSGWQTRLRSADGEFLRERDAIVARTRDLARNAPAIAAAARRRVNSAVGVGWRLSARVDAEALGISGEEARALNSRIESAWRDYTGAPYYQIDAQRQLTFGGLLRSVARAWFVDGEAFAALEYHPGEPGCRYGTRVNLIDSDRICNPRGEMDTATLRGGVELDACGAPVAYHVRQGHPGDVTYAAGTYEWVRVERWTKWGRPQFLHIYDRERAGQTRGVTQLAAALKAVRGLEKFTDATLETATLNAMIFAFIKSAGGPQAVSESLSVDQVVQFEEARKEFYGSNTVRLGDGVIAPVLPHGDEISLQTASRDVAQFENFVRAVLRQVAAAAGVTYEELSMDYSTTNYSSARAAMIHAWAEARALQTLLEEQFVMPVYAAWLEEALEDGAIEIPAGAAAFDAAPQAWLGCRWVTPGKGYIDPTKEAQASDLRIANGTSSKQKEAAEQGEDWEELLEQQAIERRAYAEKGVPYTSAEAPPAQEPGPGAPAPEDDRPAPPKQEAA